MNPGEVIAVAMKFDLPTLPSGLQIPFSPRLQSGYADYSVDAYEYVWHCHILEHEEHDMMRPVVVMPKSTPV